MLTETGSGLTFDTVVYLSGHYTLTEVGSANRC